MKTTDIKANIALAQSIAKESFGDSPAPELVAAVLNAISAQSINEQLESLAVDISRAAAVAAGN